MDDILLGRLAANASTGGHGTFDMLFTSHISTFAQSFSFYLIISLKPCIFAQRSWANSRSANPEYVPAMTAVLMSKLVYLIKLRINA